MEYINTPYDDAFRTLIQDCPALLVPLVNEVFGENYKKEEVISANANELYLKTPERTNHKRVTDASLSPSSVSGTQKRYHFECQSTPDGTMLVRMWEYDSQLALKASEMKDHILHVTFPESAVLYLRGRGTAARKLTIMIHTSEGELAHKVTPVWLSSYSLQDIMEKNLLFLIPFYLFRYEPEFAGIDADPDKLEQLAKEYETIAGWLDHLCVSGEIRAVDCGSICDLTGNVAMNLAAKYENVKKEVLTVMGGKVISYRTKEIYNDGIEQGIEQGIEKGIEQGKSLLLKTQVRKKLHAGKPAETIAEEVEESQETVEHLIREIQAEEAPCE